MLDHELIDKALELQRAIRVEYDDLSYIRFVDSLKNIPRGTAVFDNEVIYGYPSIGRVLSLQSGLQAQFKQPFWMEEKVDGFNVRICKLHGRVIALSRGGFICPFTTDRTEDFIDVRIFDHYPGIVLCAEVAGPDNPYMDSGPPFIKSDVQLFVFDISYVNRRQYVSYEEKEHILSEFDLPSVQRYGRFELGDIHRIQEILLRLNGENREGVIFKEDSPNNHRAKYTTANTNILDIEAGAYTMLDLPPQYFENRVLRLMLFLEEQGISDTEELQNKLGAAYFKGLLEAIQQVHKHHKVFRTFRCRFRQRENAVKLLNRMQETGNHVQIMLRELKQENGYWLLVFEKVFAKSSGTLSSLLGGTIMFD